MVTKHARVEKFEDPKEGLEAIRPQLEDTFAVLDPVVENPKAAAKFAESLICALRYSPRHAGERSSAQQTTLSPAAGCMDAFLERFYELTGHWTLTMEDIERNPKFAKPGFWLQVLMKCCELRHIAEERTKSQTDPASAQELASIRAGQAGPLGDGDDAESNRGDRTKARNNRSSRDGQGDIDVRAYNESRQPYVELALKLMQRGAKPWAVVARCFAASRLGLPLEDAAGAARFARELQRLYPAGPSLQSFRYPPATPEEALQALRDAGIGAGADTGVESYTVTGDPDIWVEARLRDFFKRFSQEWPDEGQAAGYSFARWLLTGKTDPLRKKELRVHSSLYERDPMSASSGAEQGEEGTALIELLAELDGPQGVNYRRASKRAEAYKSLLDLLSYLPDLLRYAAKRLQAPRAVPHVVWAACLAARVGNLRLIEEPRLFYRYAATPVSSQDPLEAFGAFREGYMAAQMYDFLTSDELIRTYPPLAGKLRKWREAPRDSARKTLDLSNARGRFLKEAVEAVIQENSGRGKVLGEAEEGRLRRGLTHLGLWLTTPTVRGFDKEDEVGLSSVDDDEESNEESDSE